MTLDELLEVFRSDERIAAACYCASVRRGVDDGYSDIDVWLFMVPGSQLSQDYVWSELIPSALSDAGLEEGRNDTWADYVVLNMLVDGRILNLKFLRMELFSDFCRVAPSWDLDYMENLENYWTMKPIFDKDGVIATHKKWLEHYALRKVGEELVPELMRRYAIHYWRSVYQGVLRDETICWTNQIYYLAELLVSLAHLLDNRLPPCKKWILSNHSFDSVGEPGRILRDLLDHARRVDITDKRAVLATYAMFSRVEEVIFDLELVGWDDHWWRRVLDERMRNHEIPDELRKAIATTMDGYLRVAD